MGLFKHPKSGHTKVAQSEATEQFLISRGYEPVNEPKTKSRKAEPVDDNADS